MTTSDLQFKNGNPGAVQYGNFINYYEFNPPSKRTTLLPHNIWTTSTADCDNSKNTYLALDIGCNAGNLTNELQCFLRQHLSSGIRLQVLAVDIDPVLIERAKENYTSGDIQFECSDCTKPQFKALLQKFFAGHQKSKFDAIFCFSTTMWIHLNHGDEGLRQFLMEITSVCDLFVVEPQPWKCYKSAIKRMRGIIKFPHFIDIKLRFDIVHDIEHFLMNNLNMRKVYESAETEWKRKIFCFTHS